MRKQIDEMKNLANLRKERDYLNLDIQEMELRITQLKKYLGVCILLAYNFICRFSTKSLGQQWVKEIRRNEQLSLTAIF